MNKVGEYIADEELLQYYRKSGDLYYFVEAYRRYMPLVYGVALKYLKRAEDAQNAVMELCLELAERVKDVEIKYFKPWLYSCTRNYCLMEIRKKRREEISLLDDSFMEFCVDFYLNYDEDKYKVEQELQECIELLPEEQQTVVSSFYLKELSYKEIEKQTGLTLNRIKSYIQNGKRNLKMCLERKGVLSDGAI